MTAIQPGDQAVLHTTLRRLRDADACTEGYTTLRRALGKGWRLDKPINLLQILDSNGAADCIWALRATMEPCERQARLIAADCAEAVLALYEAKHPGDIRPRVAVETARRFARGAATHDELDAARAATWAAARAAAWVAASDAAWVAARAAARDAASDAAWVAASDAAWVAARAAAWEAAWANQADIIRRYLLSDEEKS